MADLQFRNLYCANDSQNTGDLKCAPEPGFLQDYIAIPEGITFTRAQIKDAATAFATLQALLFNPNKELRGYLFKGAVSATPTYTAATTETSEYGTGRPLLPQMASLIWKFWNKGKCWYKKALSFNKKNASYRYILLDKSGLAIFNQVGDDAFTGFKMSGILIDADTLMSGTAGVLQNHTMWFQDYQNDYGINFAIVQVLNANRLTSLIDLTLLDITSTITPTPAVGTYYIQVLGACGGTDYAASYITLFETETAGQPWIIKNNTTKLAIPITAAVYHPESKSVALALTTGNANWVLDDDVEISLPATNVLAAAPINMIGFELDSAIVVPN